MTLPRARNDDLVVQEVFDELVIYDLKRDRVHSLNPTAALVWRHCDGQTTPAEMMAVLQEELSVRPHQEDLLWLTLDRLEKARLLETNGTTHNGLFGAKITRRQALRRLGIAVALLPVVTSIVAPEAAQAQSSPCGGRCGSDKCCCQRYDGKVKCVDREKCEQAGGRCLDYGQVGDDDDDQGDYDDGDGEYDEDDGDGDDDHDEEEDDSDD